MGFLDEDPAKRGSTVAGLTVFGREAESGGKEAAVSEALTSLRNSGFVGSDAGSVYSYLPASTDIDAIGARIEAVYAAKPMAVAKAIMSAPSDKLRIFADAFKLKER